LNPLKPGLKINQSLIPIDAIFNKELDSFKEAELLSGISPTPLTLMILKNVIPPNQNL
jgi:hypothetical protein